MDELLAQEAKPIKGQVSVTIGLTSPTKRLYDIDNRIKPVLDLIVKAGVIEDDSIRIVRRITVCAVDSCMPGATISIEAYDEEERDIGLCPRTTSRGRDKA